MKSVYLLLIVLIHCAWSPAQKIDTGCGHIVNGTLRACGCSVDVTDPHVKVIFPERCRSGSRSVPDSSPITNSDRMGSTENNRAGSEHGNDDLACWSSKFDQITDEFILTNLVRDRVFTTRKLRQTADQYGGLGNFIQQFEQQKSQFETLQASGQSMVEEFGSQHPIDQMIMFTDASIEMARCMLGTSVAGTTASDDPLADQVIAEATSKPPQESPRSLDCYRLGRYRDTDLVKEFDAALERFRLNEADITKQMDIAKETANVMNNNWWAHESGAEIAVELKRLTDHIQAWLGPFVPEVHEILNKGEKAGVTEDLVKAEIKEGAKSAADQEEKAAVKEALSQMLGPLGDSIVAEIEHYERVKGMEKFRLQIQYEVTRLILAAKAASDRAKGSRAEAEYIDQIKQQIDQACGNAILLPQKQ